MAVIGQNATSYTQFTVDNLQMDGNTLSSTSGDINITPLAGQDVVIDSHFEFDGTTITALTDNNTTITAYAGKNITIEGVTFDGGVLGGVTGWTIGGDIVFDETTNDLTLACADQATGTATLTIPDMGGVAGDIVTTTTAQTMTNKTLTAPTVGTQMTLNNGTTAAPTDGISITSEDLSAGNTLLSIDTEGGGCYSAGTPAASTGSIAIKVDGTVYYFTVSTTAAS